MRRLIVKFWIGLLVFCKACQPQGKDTEQTKPLIVTTTGIWADVVRNLVADSVQVLSLMGPGVDPHLYKMTQRDMRLLQEANIIFYNGLHLEGKLDEGLRELSRQKACYALAELIAPDSLIAVGKQTYDPHVWFDVLLMKLMVEALAQKIIAHMPELSDFVIKRKSAYQQQLDTLHRYIEKRLQEIPLQSRILVTAHDAFAYYGRRYGIQVKGLQGISTLSEAGLYDVRQLVDFIVERRIKAIFTETSVSPKSMKSVAEACLARGHQVQLVEGLYSDALGQLGSPAGTYIDMVRYNTQLIVDNLK